MTCAGEQDLRWSGEGPFCSLVCDFEMKVGKERRLSDSGRKQGGDWITGWLTGLCALLGVKTSFKGYYFWYF